MGEAVLLHIIALMSMKIVSFAYSMAIFGDMNGITEIWEAVSRKAGEHFEWAQAHPKFAYLFVTILLAFWLTGVLRRWKWACEWQYHGKLWLFDDCKPETKRRIYIIILSIALIVSLTMFFVWK